MKVLKLGTRRSLLAWAQSSWVAREVERTNPHLRVELEGIDTRGDKIVDVSLRNVVGKEFFVAELDDALREGRVDFTVHSMKDLSLERPEEFTLAAIPRRENPRDVILFSPHVLKKLREGKTLRIGTSSPRRLENIPVFLESALPSFSKDKQKKVELVEIRGNVNTRLARIHEPADSARALDGVVLAFAGLIRLWADNKGQEELKKLLVGARWMILPLRENPTAPAQGALAIECRTNDSDTRSALAPLNHLNTVKNVLAERQILADWGGGCHQRFGATVIDIPSLPQLLSIRGRKPDEEFIDELRWDRPVRAESIQLINSWNGKKLRASQRDSVLTKQIRFNTQAIFVAHSRACLAPEPLVNAEVRVWTSGVPSWFRLAAQGIWVEGCAEGLGFEELRETVQTGVLQLPEFGPEWTVLTHEDATREWAKRGSPQVMATYSLGENRLELDLTQFKCLYWSSGSQFDQYRSQVSSEAIHCCGPGKTLEHLRSQGANPLVFPSSEEWEKWLTQT